MKYIFIFFLCFATLYPQTDWEKWGKKENPYLIKSVSNKRDYSLKGARPLYIPVKLFIMGYWFFISDLDGDNCPFTPTCSTFLLQSVKETNVVQGALMFGDRFTRDANIFGRDEHYPVIKENHYYDPAANYSLDKRKIYNSLNKKPSEL